MNTPLNNENEKAKRGKLKRAVVVTANVLFPISGIYSSLKHFKKSTQNTIDSAITIKEMALDLKKRVSEDREQDLISFDKAISKSGKSVEELINVFCFKKNIYLATFYVLLLITSFLFITLVSKSRYFELLNSTFVLIPLCFIFFINSFSFQFRIWQLKSRRLSKEEKGGISDFRENSTWLSDTLKFNKKVALDENVQL